MAKDPVYGMEVDPAQAAATAEYKGKTYYFCAPGCKISFEREPEKYLDESEQGQAGHGDHDHH